MSDTTAAAPFLPSRERVGTAETVAARQVLSRHARSFRFAGLFLPADRLDVAAVVYAFCRAVDDAVDEAPSLEQAQAEAQALAQELSGQCPPRPSVALFLAVATREGIDVRFAEELVKGVSADAAARVVIADDDELLRYCYRVAGTVGGLMCGVLGVKERTALPHAIDLGIAMQLTNICRDVLEDAHKGRAYVPATRLLASGLVPAAFIDDVVRQTALSTSTVRDVGAQHAEQHDVRLSSSTKTIVRALLALADRYYASAEAGMRFIPWRSRLAILIASRVYRAIGTKLLARDADALAGRVSTTLIEKIGCALAAVAAFLRPRHDQHDPELHEALRGLPGAEPSRR